MIEERLWGLQLGRWGVQGAQGVYKTLWSMLGTFRNLPAGLWHDHAVGIFSWQLHARSAVINSLPGSCLGSTELVLALLANVAVSMQCGSGGGSCGACGQGPRGISSRICDSGI